MKSKSNIQPSVNPKPLSVQRGYADGDTIFGEVFIRNVSVDPRELIASPQYVARKKQQESLTALAVLQLLMDK